RALPVRARDAGGWRRARGPATAGADRSHGRAVHYARKGTGMNARLDQWVRNGWLRRADAALAAWVARAFPEAAPEVALAAALAARAVGDGHSALELARACEWLARLGGQGKLPELPNTESWQTLLRAAAGACRSDGSTAVAPLTLDAQGRVY